MLVPGDDPRLNRGRALSARLRLPYVVMPSRGDVEATLSRALREAGERGVMAQKQFKDLGLNEKVQVEIEVSLILQAVSEYSNADWSGHAVACLMQGLQEAVLDPVFLREKLAEMQQARDQQEDVIKRIAPGLGLLGQFPFPEEGPEE